MGERMRGLTVMQPWASAIASGKKTVENRTWGVPGYVTGKTIAIHAGRSVDWDATAAAWIAAGLVPYDGSATYPWTSGLTLGAVIAVARVTGSCVPWECSGECSPWAVKGQDHWLLADVRPLPDPVPCRGMLGLWRLPDDVEKSVREQLGEDEGHG